MLGRSSLRIIQAMPSPLKRAASTNSITTTFIAAERDIRNTRVLSKSAIMITSEGIEVPKTVNNKSAKTREGIAIKISTIRPMTKSYHPPKIAANMPSVPPTINASNTVAKAMPIVFRAPKIRRVSMSRPILSVPNRYSSDHNS